MKQSININKMVRSKVVIRSLDRDGREVARQVAKNSLTYAAADMFMNAFLRSGPSQVTHLYARFGDSGTNPGYLNPPGGDLKSTARSDFIVSSDLIRGGLWVQVLSAPSQQTSDAAHYGGNQATFFFRIPSNIASLIPPPVQPSGNFNSPGSFIYALGLAVAANTANRSQDVIITTLQAVGWNPMNLLAGDFTAFPIPSGGQIAIDYTVPFEVATP
jgi:hypothetical protein